jgi:hypothetical protein
VTDFELLAMPGRTPGGWKQTPAGASCINTMSTPGEVLFIIYYSRKTRELGSADN